MEGKRGKVKMSKKKEHKVDEIIGDDKEKEIKIESSEDEKIDEQNEDLDLNDEEIVDEISEIMNKNIALEKEVNELKDQLLRRVAEFENYKKRTETYQSELLKYAAENFILNILPVYDDLGRSLEHIKEAKDINAIKAGLKLVFDKFSKTLDDQGVKKMETVGEPFDHNFHEALMQQPAEGVEPHTVLTEVETEYMYKDKVLKHAKVIVSQEVEETSDNDNKED